MPLGHRAGDGHDFRVHVGQLDQRVGKDLRVGLRAGSDGLDTTLRIVGVGPDAMILLLLRHADLEALALLRDDVEQHRALVVLGELEGVDERLEIVAVDRAIIRKAHLLENQAGAMAGGKQPLDRPLDLQCQVLARLAGEALDQLLHAAVQVLVARVGDDVGQVLGDRADVLVDRPLVVVEDDDQALGVVGDVVERLVGDAAGESRIAAKGDHALGATAQVARRRHAQRRGERGAGVARAEGVVLALGAEHEAVEAAGLADGMEAVAPAGEQLVHVGLVADVEDEGIGRRIEDAMQRDGQLDHAQIRPEVAAGLGQHGDQFVADFLGQRGQLVHRQLFNVGGRIDRVEKASHKREQ